MNTPRTPEQTEAKAIADLWWRSWHDAHSDIVPRELVELRTRESFISRVQDNIDIVRVIGAIDEPVGMCYIIEDQMKQLFVSSIARGSGAALALLKDAENNLRKSGVKSAWLSCAVGNTRAERFYSKSGWSNVGKMVENLETQNGVFKLETSRFEKRL